MPLSKLIALCFVLLHFVPFVSVHVVMCLFVTPPPTASITLISSFPPSFLWLSPLQPSSPGDYYSSVESDLKVELTEKLFALDTDGRDSPIDTEVNTSTFPRLCFSFIDLTFEAVFTESD